MSALIRIRRKLRYWSELRHHARALRCWLSYNLLPREYARAIDTALAFGYSLERQRGWAKAADKNGEYVIFYLPKSMLPVYDAFMDSPAMMPDDSVYVDAGLWDKDGHPL